jgi:hypothetical protein
MYTVFAEGISGPCALRLSAFGAKVMSAMKYRSFSSAAFQTLLYQFINMKCN